MLTELGIVQRTFQFEHVHFIGESLLPNPGNISWDAICQDCCVPAHQEDRKFGEGPPDLLLLLPIRVPRLCCG